MKPDYSAVPGFCNTYNLCTATAPPRPPLTGRLESNSHDLARFERLPRDHTSHTRPPVPIPPGLAADPKLTYRTEQPPTQALPIFLPAQSPPQDPFLKGAGVPRADPAKGIPVTPGDIKGTA